DSHSPLEDAGPSKDIVTFEGSLQDGVFLPVSAPKIRTPDSNAPKLLVEIAGGAAPVEVPLPDAKLENGVFELGVTLRTEAGFYTVPSASAGPDPVLVRMFTHYKANNVPRPVIAFITGTDEGFFDAATAYWRLNADAVLVRKGMSLSEILTTLDALAPQLGPLGQVNIVAHGNPEHLKMKLFPDDPRAFLHEDKLKDSFHALVRPATIDAQTEVYFRSCNAGLNQALLKRLKSTCFPDARFLRIPKWPQGYESKTENKRDARGKPTTQVVTVATEFFLEQLHLERPTPAE